MNQELAEIYVILAFLSLGYAIAKVLYKEKYPSTLNQFICCVIFNAILITLSVINAFY